MRFFYKRSWHFNPEIYIVFRKYKKEGDERKDEEAELYSCIE